MIIGAAIGVATLVPSQAAAAFELYGPGYRYDPANDNDGLGIAFCDMDDGDNLQTSTVDAAARWNEKMTPQFTVGMSCGASTQDVSIHTFDGSDTLTGYTVTYPGSDHYVSDPKVYWNTTPYYDLNDGFDRRGVILHELGHSYGLDDTTQVGCDGNNTGIMYYAEPLKVEQCNWYYPTTDDYKGATVAHKGDW